MIKHAELIKTKEYWTEVVENCIFYSKGNNAALTTEIVNHVLNVKLNSMPEQDKIKKWYKQWESDCLTDKGDQKIARISFANYVLGQVVIHGKEEKI